MITFVNRLSTGSTIHHPVDFSMGFQLGPRPAPGPKLQGIPLDLVVNTFQTQLRPAGSWEILGNHGKWRIES